MHLVEWQVEESSLIAPLLRPWARSCREKTPPPPTPIGRPSISVDGLDPDRILVIGGGPAAGAGASDHDVALPGCLARALRDRTGRGAIVEARGKHLALLEHLPALAATADLQRFDVLVVFIGLEDGAQGFSPRRWKHDLLQFIDRAQRAGGRDALVLLVRIPPASAMPIYTGPLVLLADRRIVRLNRVAGRIAQEHPKVSHIALPAPGPDVRPGSAAWYRQCGDALADLLAPVLDAHASSTG